MTTKAITLELTQDQVITTLEAVTHELLRLRRFIDRQYAWDASPNARPETLVRLVTLESLVSILKAQVEFKS